ncbi:MAG: TetR/AcrR family transcriptional regulator [Actinomycetota bacterium]
MASDDWVLRLVRGRQQLSREQDVTSARVQLLDGLARAMAENGYARTSVADIAARAGFTSDEFYAQFADIESCFLAAYDLGIEVLATTVQDSLGSADRPPLVRLDRLLASYLDVLATEPAFARTFLIEVYAAGPRALERRMEALRRFAALFAEILAPTETSDGTLDPFICEAIVGAISSVVTTRVAEGKFDQLPALREPIMGFVRRLLETAPPAGFEPATTA